MPALRLGVAALAAVLLLARTSAAHEPPPRTPVREFVRLQGTVRPDGDAPAGRLQLTVLGAAHAFAATAHDVYGLTPEATAPPGTSYSLQGPRPLLARFAGARPDQTVTILAEHRPGSTDLFVLALDLCPPR